jgi:hypothetical protein
VTKELIDKSYQFTHNVWWKLFDELDVEGLEGVKALITAVNMDDSDGAYNYYNGVIETILHTKYGICPLCKVAHDKDDYAVFENLMSTKKSTRLTEANKTAAPKLSFPSKDSKDDHRPGTYL